ncbi:MAG: polysaccharide biosynthesis protein, partial [Solirubrobacteraceae bacterium]
MMDLDHKTILITGATGSFGKALIDRILNEHEPQSIRVYSRDELKQYELQRQHADEDRLRFMIGDVRDLPRLSKAS